MAWELTLLIVLTVRFFSSLKVDVVGNPITELIHPDDVQQLRELLDVNVLSMLHSKQHMFVVRMKCNLSSYTKSSKIHYKVRILLVVNMYIAL